MRRSFSLCLVALLLLAGCAARGPFPSLAPRAVERELAALDDAPEPIVQLADDPAVAAKISALLAEAQRGETEFQAAIGAADRAVSAAGSEGSDSWVEAQQAVSRLEAARGRTTDALAELDAFGLARAQAGPPLSPADRSRIETATAEIQALADTQRDRILPLRSKIAPN